MPRPAQLARVRKIQIRVFVDANGTVIRDSIQVAGSTDASFTRDLINGMAKIKWRPGVLEDCWVPGWGTVSYDSGLLP